MAGTLRENDGVPLLADEGDDAVPRLLTGSFGAMGWTRVAGKWVFDADAPASAGQQLGALVWVDPKASRIRVGQSGSGKPT